MSSNRERSFDPRATGENSQIAQQREENYEPRVTGKDFELALQRAESLLSDIDGSHQKLAVIRSGSRVLLIVLVLAVALLASFSSDFLRAILALAEGLLSAALVMAIARDWAAAILRQLRRDELSMIDLVSMLRELPPWWRKKKSGTIRAASLPRFALSVSPLAWRVLSQGGRCDDRTRGGRYRAPSWSDRRHLRRGEHDRNRNLCNPELSTYGKY
ncbi:MAG TPA: hypothetical protein VGG16_17195 [Streptosporangiaceae bacterium]